MLALAAAYTEADVLCNFHAYEINWRIVFPFELDRVAGLSS